MAKFKISPTTTVAELKEQFRNEVGGILRIYEGRSEAAEGATLVSLGAKEGELECRTSRTVGKFEEAFQNDLNLKVKVYTKDNWVKVLDGITLAVAGQLPNGMTKAKMEEYLSYKRDEKEETAEVVNEENETDNSGNEFVIKFFKGFPIIDITLDEVKVSKDSNDLVEYANENYSAPAIGVVDYGDDWDNYAWVFVTDDPDEAMYPAFDFIEEKQNEGCRNEITHLQSTACNLYGFNKDAFSIEGTIGCALNDALDSGKHSYLFKWDAGEKKILFRVKYSNGWRSRIFFALSNGETETLDCLTDEGFEKIIHNFEHPDTPVNIPLYSDDIKIDSKPLGKVKLDGKYGFINDKSTVVIPFVFDFASKFDNGYASVGVNGKYGVIDAKGNQIIEPKFDSQPSIKNGFIVVELDGKYGMYDTNGKIVLPVQYDDMLEIGNGLIPVKVNDKWGFVDKNNQIVIEPIYHEVHSFEDGYAKATKDGCKWGVINTAGTTVIAPNFDKYYLTHLGNGCFSVKEEDKYGILDTNDKWIVEPIYDDLSFLRDGLITAEKDGKSGYINLQGEVVIPLQFDRAWDFKNGQAEVELNGEEFKIDKQGNRIE